MEDTKQYYDFAKLLNKTHHNIVIYKTTLHHHKAT